VEQNFEISQKKERELRNKNEDLQEEYERVKNKLRNIEDYYKKEIETLINEHSAKLNKSEQALDQYNHPKSLTPSFKVKKAEIIREKDNEILSLTDQVQDMKKVLAKVRNERDEGLQRLEQLSSNDELTRRDRHIDDLVAEIVKLEGQLNDIALNKTNDPSVLERFDALKQKNQALLEENQRLREGLADAGVRASPRDTQQSPGDRDTKNSQVLTQGDELNRSNIADLQKISDLSIKVRLQEDEIARLKAKIPVSGEKTKRELELEKENVYLHNMVKNLTKDEAIHRPSYNSVEYPNVRTGYNAPVAVSTYIPSRSAANDRPVSDYRVTIPSKGESPLKSQKEIDSLISTVITSNLFYLLDPQK
jgi:hypothetical protein